MKRLLILAYVAVVSYAGYANNTSTASINYSNAFIFNEQRIEFAVFPDGQFDFNILDQYGEFHSSSYNGYDIDYFEDFNINYNNGGYGYNPYLQFDDFGAIVQIKHVPIFYDYYGRVNRIGLIRIRYNYRGFVQQIGRMYINYNANLGFHCHGYINTHNRFYTPQPWHRQYRRPRVHLNVVYDRPYRRHYTPIRRHFIRPFTTNHRPNVRYHINGGQSNAVVLNNGYRYDNATVRSHSHTNTAVQTQNHRSLTRSSVQRQNNPMTHTPSDSQTTSTAHLQTRYQRRPGTVTTQTRSTVTQNRATTRSQTRSNSTRSRRPR